MLEDRVFHVDENAGDSGDDDDNDDDNGSGTSDNDVESGLTK